MSRKVSPGKIYVRSKPIFNDVPRTAGGRKAERQLHAARHAGPEREDAS